ncbi:Darcynin 1 [Ketobacter sp. MCCC 1A13808]|uniref:darcynin family protein n=1 Tax=Ketobacter sp. MCCC 1A13808 TaxID=2602738 RepID=UPI0012EC4185|nr:darcynin family protein [Ketobacter sp. MCCC 1A13808]MVF14946.1 Darcynin 1 [Ketobacter sp. MCCC 1A13808]
MPRKYTFFIHMNATKEWLSLSRDDRENYFSHIKTEIFAKYPSVSVRLYDVEAFSTKCSDIAVYETENIQDYYFMIDALRDSKIYTVPYFEIVDIFPTIEDGFVEYESSLSSNA